MSRSNQMARRISLSKAQLLALIHGTGQDDIDAAALDGLLPSVSRSTINRRLLELIKDGALIPSGEGAGRKYIVVTPRVAAALADHQSGEVVPLSPRGKELRHYLRQPAATRRPVGYQRSLVDNYIPNQTFILPAALRQKLAVIGATGHERPAGTYARDILSRLLVDLSWASSRLEGNTYTVFDTQRLIEDGVEADGKKATEALMIMNHKRAIEFIIDNAESIRFSPMYVRNIHACLSEGLLANPNAVGSLRQIIVKNGESTYLPPQLPQFISEMFDLVLAKAEAIEDPFEQSAFALSQIAYLQPFEDVNKRTSRMCANIPLIRHKLCPLSFVDVTERDYIDAMLGVYERNDFSIFADVYEWTYERSVPRYRAVMDSLGKPDPIFVIHRATIDDAIRKAVVDGADPAPHCAHLPSDVAERLVAIIHERIAGLNEGNFARFGITPAEFERWQISTEIRHC